MLIISDLIGTIKKDAEIKRAGVCKRWSYLQSRNLGIAFNFGGAKKPPIFSKESALGVADLAHSKDVASASIGVAAISSLITFKSKPLKIKGEEIIYKLAPQKRVVMVGHFKSADRIRKVAGHLDILELKPQEGDLPAKKGSQIIPEADVLIVTSSTIVNHTLEEILKFKKKRAFVILLGPSAPPSEVYFDYGVDAVCSALFKSPDKMILHLKYGGNFHTCGGVEYIVLVKNRKLF